MQLQPTKFFSLHITNKPLKMKFSAACKEHGIKQYKVLEKLMKEWVKASKQNKSKMVG